MGNVRHTEKVVLVNSLPQQLTARVLPPSYAPDLGTMLYLCTCPGKGREWY